jgi:hypothetical protein
MADNESIKPDAINKETLELLQLRLESSIRGDFLKSVAIPIGGGGLVAIGLALWVWIPTQVREFFDKKAVQDQIEKTIQGNVEKYFKDDSVQRTIAQQVQLQVAQEVKATVAARLTNYFASPEGIGLVRQLVVDSVGDHFKTREMQNRVSELVGDFLKNDGRQLITETINQALKPTTNFLASTIFKNRERLVTDFEQQSLHGEPKQSLEHLQQFIRPENIAAIRNKRLPVVLTKEIRERFQYNREVIQEYLEVFRRAFAEQFQYVAILFGPDQRLVALVRADRFERVFRQNAPPVMDLLNSEGRVSEAILRQRFGELFGVEVTQAAVADRKVFAVLTDPALWPHPERLDEPVAVVDGKQRLLATTTRGRLIDGIVQMP